MNYLLKVKKKPYQNHDYLSFVFYKAEKTDLGGFQSNYKILKDYRRKDPFVPKKDDNYVCLIDCNETEYEVYFSCNKDLTKLLINWADSIIENQTCSEQQVEAFLNLLQDSKEFKRL